MKSPISTVIVPPGEGLKLHAFGDEVIMHLTAKQTGGSLSLWTLITPPGGGPLLHSHQNEDEWFVVQEGRVGFFTDGRWQETGPGSVIFLPRQGIHTFKNLGETPSRMLVSASPGGFEAFFGQCAREFAKAKGPNMKRIVEIASAHGIQFVA